MNPKKIRFYSPKVFFFPGRLRMHQDIRFYCFIMRVVACSVEKWSLEGASGVLFTARGGVHSSNNLRRKHESVTAVFIVWITFSFYPFPYLEAKFLFYDKAGFIFKYGEYGKWGIAVIHIQGSAELTGQNVFI